MSKTTMSKTITRGSGCLGDHELIDTAIENGYDISQQDLRYHNWDRAFCDSYDLGLDRAARRAIKFLQSKGFTVVNEDGVEEFVDPSQGREESIAKKFTETLGESGGRYDNMHGSGWPSQPEATTFNDEVYKNIMGVMSELKGRPLQDVIEALSEELDIRVQNLDPALQKRIKALYDRINKNA